MTERPTKLVDLVRPLPSPDEYEFPWFPAYVDDDQALAASLTTLEDGALERLKRYAWKQTPRCSLPDNDARLAVIAGVSLETWRADVGPALRELMTPIEGGRLMLVNLRRRFLEQVEKHVSYSLRGAKGGRPSKAGTKQPGKLSGNHRDKLPESSGLQQHPSVSDLGSPPAVGERENGEQDKLTGSSAFPGSIEPEVIERWIADHPAEVATMERLARAEWQIGDTPVAALTPRKAQLLLGAVQGLVVTAIKAAAQTSGPASPPPPTPAAEEAADVDQPDSRRAGGTRD